MWVVIVLVSILQNVLGANEVGEGSPDGKTEGELFGGESGLKEDRDRVV